MFVFTLSQNRWYDVLTCFCTVCEVEKGPRLDSVWFLALGEEKEDIHSIGTHYVKSVPINIPASITYLNSPNPTNFPFTMKSFGED